MVKKKGSSRRSSKESSSDQPTTKKSKRSKKRKYEASCEDKDTETKGFVPRVKIKWSQFIESIQTTTSSPKNQDDDDLEEFLPTSNKGFVATMKRKWSEFINSFIPSKNQLNDKRLQNRMKMCILAVCLMWATSLRVAVYVASQAIKVPPMQMLYQSCKNTFQIANDEKDKYSKCVDVQLDQCTNDLHRSIVMEVRRVNQSTFVNSEKVNHARQLYENCTSNYNDLRFALEGWVDAGQSLPLDEGNCSKSEQEQIMNDVGDVNLIRKQAMSLTEEYSQQSQSTVKRIATYAELRANYDVEYLDNHTKEMQDVVEQFVISLQNDLPKLDVTDLIDALYEGIDEAMSCVSPRSAIKGICKTGKGMMELMQESYDAWQDYVDAYIDRIEGLHARFRQYWLNAQKAYKISSDFYYMVQRSILADPVFSWMWGDRFTVDVTTFLPEEVPYPKIADFKALLERIPKLDSFYPNVEPAFEKFMLKLDETVYGIEKSIELFRHRIEYGLLSVDNIPRLLPEDYNPPQYVGTNVRVIDLETEKELHSNITKSFVSRSNSALNEFSKYTKNFTSAASEIEIPTINITSIKSRMSNVDLSFESMTKPTIEFDLWFFKFGSVSDMLFLLDFVLRTYFSIRMFFKYWDAGSIKLPEVDVRIHKEIKNPFKMSNGRLIILIFTNPLIGACLFAIVATWVFAFASSVYTPLYIEYINGCIPANGNGTFTTSNIYSTSYNFAYQSGSSSLVKGLEKFDAERSSKCSKLYTTSVTKQNEDMLQMQSFQRSLEATDEQMELLDKCINKEIVYEKFQLACCGQYGYDDCDDTNSTQYICPLNNRLETPIPYQSPDTYLSRNQCDEYSDDNPLWNLIDATFECETLPSCQITCMGPQKDKLRMASKECGCIIEWFLHSVWLKVFITLMVYALLNASRTGFIDGLSRVLWKSLHPGSFSVWATCDNKGKFLSRSFQAGGAVESNGKDDPRHTIRLNGEMRKQIEWNSFVFRVGGAVIMVVAILLNVPWIIVVIRSPDTTRPNWLL